MKKDDQICVCVCIHHHVTLGACRFSLLAFLLLVEAGKQLGKLERVAILITNTS